MTDDENAQGHSRLPRVLGPSTALSMVVGSVIGSGIFIVPASVAKGTPYLGVIAIIWIVAGIFSAAGALTLAELAAMMPRAGGPYVYLSEAYGKLSGFLFGWTEFLVIRAGSVAALAAGFALYFSGLVPAPGGMPIKVWQAIISIVAIVIVATINVLGTKQGGRVQVGGTILKVGALAGMMILPFVIGGANPSNLSPVWPSEINLDLFKAVMAAMIGVLWAYDGWVNTSALAEEIRDPGRNIPRALLLGMVILIAVYLGMTFMYHMVLPLDDVIRAASAEGDSRQVAAEYCHRLLGSNGRIAISLIVMTSIFIALNGNALAGPRAYFAMARDGLFPRSLCRIHPKYETPANAIIAQSTWAIALTILATWFIVAEPPSSGYPDWILKAGAQLHKTPLYDVMYTYVIFGGTVFYTAAIGSVFVFRKTMPDAERPYRTLGYPITPAIYLAASFLIMGSMLMQTPFESMMGLAIVAAGIPAFAFFSIASRKPANPG